MKKFVNIIEKYRWAIVVVVPLLVVALSYNLKNLSFEGSYRIWFGEDSKILQDYDSFRKVFGNDDSIIIAFKDENGVFTKKALSSIERITKQLWQTKYITRVDSLTSYQYIYADKNYPDEIIVEDFIQDIDKQNQEYFLEKKDIALNDPQLQTAFINKDGTTTMIIARLTPKAGENEDISFEIMGLVKSILENETNQTGYKYWLNGGAPITTSFVSIAQHDGGVFTPLVFVVVSLLLLFIFKRVSGVLIPLSVVVLTIGVVLSLQVLLGYKLNNFTANIAVFIVAIGIADSIHIYSIWDIYKKQGEDNKTAITHTLQKNLLPIFFTSITTAIGFSSLGISEVVPVSTLGIATASGAILAFVLSVVFMPACLFLVGKKTAIQQTLTKKNITPKNDFFEKYASFLIAYDKKIVFVTTLLFSFFAIGLLYVKIDSNTIRYFDKEVEIRKSADFMMKNITGPMSYEIVVNSQTKNGIKDPEFLKTVQKFYDEYQAQFSDIRKLSSLLDVIKQFHKVMHGDDENYYKVPDSKGLIAQYLLLYSLSLPQGMEINDKLDIEEQSLRVTARANMVDTSKDLQMIRWAESWWKDTPYTAQVHGQNVMFAYMQKNVTDTLIYSISIALVLVSFMMLIIFKRVKMLPIFILPNILPIILVLGIMGWLGINIDLGVAVSGAIILGVAVDDTIHFFVKYFDAQKKGYDLQQSFSYVVQYAGKAILFTSVILIVAFLVFMGSDFAPNYNFGIVTASALFIAFVADVLLLPAILSILEKRKIKLD
jgi:predicted RND superfamily exporter protein